MPADTSTPLPSAATYIVSDACENARNSTDAVVRFYRAISARAFSAARACFDSQEAATLPPFDVWAAAYSTTVTSRLVATRPQSDGTIWVELQAVDNYHGSLLAHTFTGAWTVDSNLQLESAQIRETSRTWVNAVPDTDIASIMSAESRAVVSWTKTTVTGSPVADDVVVSEAAGCSDCAARRVSIFNAGMLVFSQDFPSGVDSVRGDGTGSGFVVSTPGGEQAFSWDSAGFDSR
jgi:hypothetical protein